MKVLTVWCFLVEIAPLYFISPRWSTIPNTVLVPPMSIPTASCWETGIMDLYSLFFMINSYTILLSTIKYRLKYWFSLAILDHFFSGNSYRNFNRLIVIYALLS